MGGRPDVRVRRVYDGPEPDDGTRVLVDRIWPRGLTKDKARFDLWLKQIAPSTELRKWYSHDPERFEEFGRRYREELKDAERAQALKYLRELARSGTLTLLTATGHAEISQAAVLADLIRGRAVRRLPAGTGGADRRALQAQATGPRPRAEVAAPGLL